jgi:hypothetical protein
MNALEFFLPQHARPHGVDLGDPRSLWDRMLEGLSDEQIRLRPSVGLNSIAWIIWHTARVEDVAVNLVVTVGCQVFDDRWATRLGVDRRDIGVSMSDADVAELSSRLDVAAARSRRAACSAAASGPEGSVNWAFMRPMLRRMRRAATSSEAAVQA